MKESFGGTSWHQYMKDFSVDSKWYIKFYFPDILFSKNTNLSVDDYAKLFQVDTPFVTDLILPQQDTNMVEQNINGIRYAYPTAPNTSALSININFRDNVNYGMYNYLTRWHESRVNADYTDIGGGSFASVNNIIQTRLMNYPEDYFGFADLILTDIRTEKRLYIIRLRDFYPSNIDSPQLKTENTDLFTFSGQFTFNSNISMYQVPANRKRVYKTYGDKDNMIDMGSKSVEVAIDKIKTASDL